MQYNNWEQQHFVINLPHTNVGESVCVYVCECVVDCMGNKKISGCQGKALKLCTHTETLTETALGNWTYINIMVIKYCTINYWIVRLNLINYSGCCVLTIITVRARQTQRAKRAKVIPLSALSTALKSMLQLFDLQHYLYIHALKSMLQLFYLQHYLYIHGDFRWFLMELILYTYFPVILSYLTHTFLAFSHMLLTIKFCQPFLRSTLCLVHTWLGFPISVIACRSGFISNGWP